MGGAVVIPVIIGIHTDFLCPFQTPDMTLTRRNQMLRDDDIFSKVEHKKNQTKTLTRTLQLLHPLHLLTDTTVATATTLTRLTTHYSYYSYYGYHSFYSYHSYYTYYSYYSYDTHYSYYMGSNFCTYSHEMALGSQDISWGHTWITDLVICEKVSLSIHPRCKKSLSCALLPFL